MQANPDLNLGRMAAHSFLVDDTFQICGVVLMGKVTKYMVPTVLILEVVAELVWNNRSGLKHQKVMVLKCCRITQVWSSIIHYSLCVGVSLRR